MEGRRGGDRRAALALLTSVVVALGGSGCSSDPGQAPAPGAGLALPESPSSSAPTTVASGTTSAGFAGPAQVPAAARRRTPQGAQAFVRHFLAEYNRAATSPTPGLLKPLSLPSCKTCAGLEDDIRELIGKGHRFAVSPARIDGIASYACNGNQERCYVDVRVYQRGANLVDRDNNVVRKINAVSDVMGFDVRWVFGRWSVSSIKLVRYR